MSGAIRFDFVNKKDDEFELDEVAESHSPETFLWANLSGDDVSRAAEFTEIFEINNPLLGSEDMIGTPRFTDLCNCIYFSLQDISLKDNRAVVVPVQIYLARPSC